MRCTWIVHVLKANCNQFGIFQHKSLSSNLNFVGLYLVLKKNKQSHPCGMTKVFQTKTQSLQLMQSDSIQRNKHQGTLIFKKHEGTYAITCIRKSLNLKPNVSTIKRNIEKNITLRAFEATCFLSFKLLWKLKMISQSNFFEVGTESISMLNSTHNLIL